MKQKHCCGISVVNTETVRLRIKAVFQSVFRPGLCQGTDDMSVFETVLQCGFNTSPTPQKQQDAALYTEQRVIFL